MQKLFRRGAFSGTVLFTSGKPILTLDALPLPPGQLAMPATAAAFHGGGLSNLAASWSTKKLVSVAAAYGGGNCRICRCAIEGGAGVRRAWGGTRAAWFRSGSDGFVVKSAGKGSDGCSVEDGEDGEDGERGSDEKPLRLQRRQRGSLSSNSGPVPANVDLLTIPGVGPRNLRKLVDKGIGGVNELKQLYREKVLFIFNI